MQHPSIARKTSNLERLFWAECRGRVQHTLDSGSVISYLREVIR